MYSLTAHPTSLQVPYPAHSTQSLKKKKKQKNFPLIAVPDHFGNKDQFHGRQFFFFHGPGIGGWFWDDPSALLVL